MEPYWSELSASTCMPGCWCEAARLGESILEPTNTWTNFIYILIGFIVLFTYKCRKGNLLFSKRYSLTYSIAMMILGVGSGLFHASRTTQMQIFDVFGMYCVAWFFFLFNFVRLQKIHFNKFIGLYVGGLTLMLIGMQFFSHAKYTNTLFIFILIGTAVVSIYAEKVKKLQSKAIYIKLAMGVLVIAYLIWNLDKHRIICYPYSIINGHGIWHIMTGIAAYLAYLYFASSPIKQLDQDQSQ